MSGRARVASCVNQEAMLDGQSETAEDIGQWVL